MQKLLESSRKKILLIEPPFYNLFGYQRWYYPITLTLVGTYMQEKGHDVKIYDADKPKPGCRSFTRTEARENYSLYGKALDDDSHPIWEEIKKELKEFSPDIVGLTSITAKIESADKVARLAKTTLGKDVKVILGGPHAQGMLQTYPDYNFGSDYDLIVTNIPDLINRKPDKNLLTDTNYNARDFSTLLTSTGCPNSCTYCCNSALNRKIIFRNLLSIEQEIKEIKDAFGGLEEISIEDDCFFSYPERFREIGNLFKEFELKFSANSRVMALSPDKISEFMENNGRRIYVGVESGSQEVLDRIEKRVKVEEIVKRTKWINESAMPWSAFFIVGFPFETLDDVKKTEEIAYKVQPTFASLNRFTPYPGTKIWREYYMDSKLQFRDLFQLNPANEVTRLPDNTEDYIRGMFSRFDLYNQSKKS